MSPASTSPSIVRPSRGLEAAHGASVPSVVLAVGAAGAADARAAQVVLELAHVTPAHAVGERDARAETARVDRRAAEADAAAGLDRLRATRGLAQRGDRARAGDAGRVEARSDLEALDGARGLVEVVARDGDRDAGAAQQRWSARTSAPRVPGRRTRAAIRSELVPVASACVPLSGAGVAGGFVSPVATAGDDSVASPSMGTAIRR